jgi:hypothetical protein
LVVEQGVLSGIHAYGLDFKAQHACDISASHSQRVNSLTFIILMHRVSTLKEKENRTDTVVLSMAYQNGKYEHHIMKPGPGGAGTFVINKHPLPDGLTAAIEYLRTADGCANGQISVPLTKGVDDESAGISL